MDQSRYWIQKERTCLNSHVLSSFGDSWEEQAFAEDAAGPLGGCIWPPRSYTCSFCRREFRSAQALGGHMNVHRRDRARLKQSPNSNQILEPNTSLGRCMLQNPNEICNPNFDLDHALFLSTSPRPSTDSIRRPFTCSFVQEQQKSTPILSWSKFEPRKRFHIADTGNQEKGYAKVIESNTTSSKKNTHQIEVHLAGNLNSRVRGRCDTPICNDKNELDDGFFYKRRRIDDDEQSLFPKASNLMNGDEAKSTESLESSPNSTLENLDLELRLGDRR
ncbi:hypothetical protein L2E82_01345 [Cichorium intybus]|uniref:Uncharacterized protein n=1 Tax=Cichorium intybus TaxID=13427 RepID=A0ACB9GYA9_CICIN|nr:hypothetical protein L2E82_01345 [Cichorium intybus]